MFTVAGDDDDRRVATAQIEVGELLALADLIDSTVGPGSRLVVEMPVADQTLLVMATLARCRQRAERSGGAVLVEPEPSGEAARMWGLGLRDFLGRPDDPKPPLA